MMPSHPLVIGRDGTTIFHISKQPCWVIQQYGNR